ncbi:MULTISPECIES: hypothetical protein [unclassified Mesorhizobium]|nr:MULTISPECIES: hypothetical protein [unclassified Mesorhizobium]
MVSSKTSQSQTLRENISREENQLFNRNMQPQFADVGWSMALKAFA